MTRVPVWSDDPAFRAAAAQLANRVRPVAEPRDAVWVIAAEGPLARADAAAAGGARAVILTGSGAVSSAVLDVLAGSGLPVIVHRPRLRADEAGDAAGDPGRLRLVVADVFSGTPEFRSATIDAIGWIRVLLGGPIVLRTARRSAGGAVASFEGPGAAPASLLATRWDAPTRASIRVRGVAPTAVEVDIDDAAGVRSIRSSDAKGEVARPARRESGARLSLRRALDALDGAHPGDLNELLHDRRLAEDVLAARAP